jgi:acyl-coenzyme A synthetase/AMP-(fatty) acid ligase
VLLDARLGRFGDNPAVRFPGGAWSYAELAGAVGSLAAGFAADGVARGRRVALTLPDSPLWIAAFLALTRLGAVVVPVSAAVPAPRATDAIGRAGATFVITDDDELMPELPRFDTAMLEHLAEAGLPDPGPAGTCAADPCYMLLTSGSSGPSKWAVHTHAAIPACIATYGRHILHLRPADVAWSVAPLASSYGLGNALCFPLGAGASAWITGLAPTPAEAARACEAGDVDVLFGVPTFWARLVRHVADGRLAAGPFADVRLAVSAGEPLPTAVWHAVRDTVGLELVDGLGSSEATNLYLSNRPNRARPGSVGYAVPGYELRVVDETGAPCDTGTAGELVVRGPTVMSGYLDDPEATQRALRDGWLHTGDRVVRERDASYRFVGRAGERFKSGGLWIDPARIEGVLHEHPAVAEVAVAGAPDELGVTRVVALVVPQDGSDHDVLRDKLSELAAAELAAHEVPRAFVFLDELPTAASGNVRRGEIGQIAAQSLGAAPVP